MKSTVEAVPLPTTGKKNFLWDTAVKGFGVIVSSEGRRTYVLQTRMPGSGTKTMRITIGPHGSPWTAEQARSKALDIMSEIRSGVDPRKKARDAVKAIEAAKAQYDHFAFDAFADRFIRIHVKGNELRSLKTIEGTFRRDIRPWFANRSVLDITDQDVKDMESHIADTRSQSSANTAHVWLNKMFMWGIRHDRLKTSPMMLLSLPYKQRKRDRYLSDKEVGILWSALDRVSPLFALHIRLLLLTGTRLREAAGIRWEEIDLDADEWVVPASRTKNKLPLLVPISAQVKKLLLD
jgi:integrase